MYEEHTGDRWFLLTHYNDVVIGAIASQITNLTIVYSIVCLDADQRKHQSSTSLAFVRGIHRGPVNSPHKWPVTRKMFPFDDVIMKGSAMWRVFHAMTSLQVAHLPSKANDEETQFEIASTFFTRQGMTPANKSGCIICIVFRMALMAMVESTAASTATNMLLVVCRKW